MKNATYTEFKSLLPLLVRDASGKKYNPQSKIKFPIALTDNAKRKKKFVIMDYKLYKAMDEYIEELECQVRLDRSIEYNKKQPDPQGIPFEKIKKECGLD